MPWLADQLFQKLCLPCIELFPQPWSASCRPDLGPRIPLDSVVQRQVIEGVLAVVRLSRSNELRKKIRLQLFDRSYGPVNVNSIGVYASPGPDTVILYGQIPSADNGLLE